MKRKQVGFTLIEILMVVFIIGLVLGLAFFTMGVFKPDQKLEHVAQRLTSQLRMAKLEAVFEQSQLGFAIDEQGYRFYKRQSPLKKWELIDNDSLFKAQALPKQTRLELATEGASSALGQTTPQVILSSGKLPVFEITLHDAHNHHYHVVSNEQGEILWEPL